MVGVCFKKQGHIKLQDCSSNKMRIFFLMTGESRPVMPDILDQAICLLPKYVQIELISYIHIFPRHQAIGMDFEQRMSFLLKPQYACSETCEQLNLYDTDGSFCRNGEFRPLSLFFSLCCNLIPKLWQPPRTNLTVSAQPWNQAGQSTVRYNDISSSPMCGFLQKFLYSDFYFFAAQKSYQSIAAC